MSAGSPDPRLELGQAFALRARQIEGLIRRGDGWRRSPASVGGAAGHKEWSHFCVFADELMVLVNWSLSDRRHGRGARIEEPRLGVLVRTQGGGWDGDVETFDARSLAVAGGSIGIRMGDNELGYDGCYTLDVRLARRPVSIRLAIRPVARPALTTSVPLGAAGSMRWFVMPYGVADGVVRAGDRSFELRGAPAYHDHDWGDFTWGADFAWEWAVALAPARPAQPAWSLIVQRISDRARVRSLSQGALLWRGASHWRTFHGPEVAFEAKGKAPAAGALRIPRVMSLVSPGCAADVPRSFEMRAASGDDALEARFDVEDVAQLAIPNDTADRAPGCNTTVVTEAHARACVEGRVRGERVRFTGPAILELNRAGA